MAGRSSKLCKLPSEVRSLIRSGVVVPGIVKCVEELVLNSIDAEATKITIRVNFEQFMIYVEDDGCGIEKEDLEFVGKRYHTSKARNKSDLTNLQTYGYRGEALASIIDCSTGVEILTKCNSNSVGYSKKFKNGAGGPIRRVAEGKISTRGCIVLVRGLLAKYLVRQKKIDKQMELQDLTLMVEHLNLINPKLSINLRDDATAGTLFESKPVRSLQEGLQRLYKQRNGIRHHEILVDVKDFTDFIEVHGLISQDPHHNRQMQFLFVNKRYIPKSRIYRLLEDQLSAVLGFANRQSTSSKDSRELSDARRNKKNSPKASTFTAEAYPIFLVNITCPWTECTLMTEESKSKVNFHNVEILTTAIQGFTTKFRRTFQPSNKLALNPRIGPALMRNNSMDRRDRSSSREKEAFTARKAAERLTVHDMQGPVHSKPAVRSRNHGDYALSSLNKPKLETRDSDNESDSSHIQIDESDDSPEQPYRAERNILPATKSRQHDKKNPTSRLQHTRTLDITGLKKRKQARDSTIQGSHVETRQKKPRLTIPSTILDKSRNISGEGSQLRRSATPFSPEADSVFISSQNVKGRVNALHDRHSKHSEPDLEVCDRMSTLSVSTRSHYTGSLCRTDPRPRVEDLKHEPSPPSNPLCAYDIVLSAASVLNKQCHVPNYAEIISDRLTERFHSNARGNEFSRSYPQQLQQLCNPIPKTTCPTEDTTKSQLPAYNKAIRHKKHASQENKVEHLVNAPAHVSSTYVPVASYLHDNQESSYFSHATANYAHQYNVGTLDTGEAVTRRSKSGESGNTSNKSEKRYGRVFNSQEFPIYKENPDSPVDLAAFQGGFAPVNPAGFQGGFAPVNPAGFQGGFAPVNPGPPEHHSGIGNQAGRRTERWVEHVEPVGEVPTPSVILEQRRDYWNNMDPPQAKPRRRSNGGEERSVSSSTEDYSQNFVSLSQQFPDYTRAERVRDSTRLPEIEEYSGIRSGDYSQSYNRQQNDSRYCRRPDFEDNLINGNAHEFGHMKPEVPRRHHTSSQLDNSSGTGPFDEAAFESSTKPETSEYFKRDSAFEEVRDLEINWGLTEKNSGLELGLTPLTPIAEFVLPEINFAGADFPAASAGNAGEGSQDITSISYPTNIAVPATVKSEHAIFSSQEKSGTPDEEEGVGTSPLEIRGTRGFVPAEPPIVTEDHNLDEGSLNMDTVLFNKPSPAKFRNAWLRKFFPEGVKKDWKRNEVCNNIIQPAGSLGQLERVDSKLAETVRSCFAEACDDDLITDKWDASCWMAATNCESFGDGRSVVHTEMPLESRNSREIRFWSTRNIQDPQISCRFTKEDLRRAVVIGQVDKKFITAKIKYGNEENSREKQMLVLFDQHAVHERIRLEKMIFESQEETEGVKRIASVDMSPPMLMNFTDTEVRVMKNFERNFSLIGVTLEVCGPLVVRVSTAPTCFVKKISNLARSNREEAIEQLLRRVIEEQVQNIVQTSGSPQPIPKTVMEVLKSAACKGAYKFGDELSLESCVELIESLKSCKAPFQCAHGRPVLVPLMNL